MSCCDREEDARAMTRSRDSADASDGHPGTDPAAGNAVDAAASALAAQDGWLRAAFDAVDLRISVFDADDRLVAMNRAVPRGMPDSASRADEMIGRTREALNRTLLDAGVISPEQFEMLLSRAPLLEMEIGGRLFVRIQRFPLPDGGLVVVTSDATEFRRSQRDLADAERSDTIGTLVAGMAHEINTPLGTALTATSWIADTARRHRQRTSAGAPVDPVQALEEIERGASLVLANLRRLSDLVGRLRLVSVDAFHEEARPVRIDHHLSMVFRALQREVRRSGHDFALVCNTDAEVVTHPSALTHVLTTFVTNSLQHAFDGTRRGQIVLTADADGDRIVLTYEDDGAGVDPSTLDRIFEPFFTTRRGSGAAGLGLPVVRNLVTQRLGGRIDSDARPGGGLRHVVSFPRVRVDA
jgi:signal transduction histidine kinase